MSGPTTPAAGVASGPAAEVPSQQQRRPGVAVPGMPGWRYQPGVGVWDDRDRQVLDWCPTVEQSLAAYNTRGEISGLRATVRVGQGAPLTVTMTEVIRGDVWERLPGARGAGTRNNREALHGIVRDQAAALPLIPTMPQWEGGRLVMPPVDVLPRGYGQVAGDDADWRALLREVARSPRMALVMGLALAGLYVRPLGRKSYMVHMPGASSEGKTSSMAAAAAVMGNPTGGDGVVGTWAVTAQGPGAWLRTLACLTGYRDELSASSMSSQALGQMVFGALEGATRDRSGREGQYLDSPGAWYGALISTGNASILGQVENEGLAARIIEITGPLSVDADHADRVVELARGAYGHALAALVERGPDPERFGKAAREQFAEMGAPAGGVLRRLAEHLSMGVAGAALIGELAGCPEFEVGVAGAARAVLDELGAELAQRGARPSDRLLAALAGSLASQPGAWPTREQYAKAVRGDAPMPREVYGWTLSGDLGGDVAVIATQLRAALAGADVDPGIALREAERRGLLLRWQGGRHRAQRLDIAGRKTRAYVITGLFTDSDEGGEGTGPVPTSGGPVPTVVPTSVPTSHTHSDQESSHSSHIPNVDVVMRAREAGTDSHTGCDRCRRAGEWCGRGDVAETAAPCVCCGRPTAMRSTCGAARTCQCAGKPAESSAADVERPAPTGHTREPGRSAERPAEPVRGAHPAAAARGSRRDVRIRADIARLDAGEAPRVLDALEREFAPLKRGADGRMHQPFWQPELPAVVDDVMFPAGWTWSRAYDGPVAVLDRSGSEISAASSVEVAHGALTHTGDAGYVGRPGCYLVHVYPWSEDGLPHPLGMAPPVGSSMWIPQPVMARLVELAKAGRWPEAEALDSWTGEPVRLRDWAGYVQALRQHTLTTYGRAAQGTDGPYERTKTAFGQAMGLMAGVAGGPGHSRTWKAFVHRTDWYQAIKGQQAASMHRWADELRQLLGPELGPVAMRNVDELLIPASTVDTVASTPRPGGKSPLRIDPLGIALGSWKVKGEQS